MLCFFACPCPAYLCAFLPSCLIGLVVSWFALTCDVLTPCVLEDVRWGQNYARTKSLEAEKNWILATMNEPLHCQTLQFLTMKYNTQPLPSFFPSIWGTDWIASSLNGSFCKAFPFLLDFGAIAGSTDCNPSTPSNEFHPGRACNDLLPGQCAKKKPFLYASSTGYTLESMFYC